MVLPWSARYLKYMTSLLQRVGDDLIRHRGAEEPAAVGANDDVLLAVATQVGRRRALRGGRQRVGPEFVAVARVEGAELLVDRRADENQVAGSGDRAARAGRAALDPFGFELRERAERDVPRDVSGVRVHGDQFAPRRL